MGKLRYLITCWVGVSLPCFKKVSVYLLARLSLWTLKGVTLRKAFTKYFTLAWFCCQSFWLHWPWCFSAHTQYAFQLILPAWVGFRHSVPVAGLLWNESFCFAHFKEVQAGANDKSLSAWLSRAGSGVVRIDPLRFLAGCCRRWLNQV